MKSDKIDKAIQSCSFQIRNTKTLVTEQLHLIKQNQLVSPGAKLLVKFDIDNLYAIYYTWREYSFVQI